MVTLVRLQLDICIQLTRGDRQRTLFRKIEVFVLFFCTCHGDNFADKLTHQISFLFTTQLTQSKQANSGFFSFNFVLQMILSAKFP